MPSGNAMVKGAVYVVERNPGIPAVMVEALVAEILMRMVAFV